MLRHCMHVSSCGVTQGKKLTSNITAGGSVVPFLCGLKAAMLVDRRGGHALGVRRGHQDAVLL